MNNTSSSWRSSIQPGTMTIVSYDTESKLYGNRIKVGTNDVLYPTEAGKLALTSDVEKVEAKIPSVEGLATETYVDNALTGYATED